MTCWKRRTWSEGENQGEVATSQAQYMYLVHCCCLIPPPLYELHAWSQVDRSTYMDGDEILRSKPGLHA
jgi:hypothetical protein